ncbi:MAG: biotin--[acetyl-CoA-carboxylase] ligase [Lachnospiraceae bacterium]|nr:biotin--[acetyl-CoA-carboxylase] ligase [Lachnospiraceae bacterium]
MRDTILERLQSADDYISGQQLSEDFGVSRTAVWKAVKRLKSDGYEIDSVPNRGYRLVSCPDIFSAQQIQRALRTKELAKKVVFFETTGSTNNDCRQLMEQGEKSILVAAANQSAGKGRRGRQWMSQENASVSFSLGLRPGLEASRISMLTLVMALAVQRAIKKQTGLESLIKWPNDLIIDSRKICGILTEMNMEMEYVSSVVVGVGINVSQTEFPEEIRDKAASLKICLGKTGKQDPVSRAALTAECVNCFEELYESVVKAGNLSPIRKEYEEKLVNVGRYVSVSDPAGSFVGTARGINDKGMLIVETEDNAIKEVYAGEVSVRGVYGYV